MLFCFFDFLFSTFVFVWISPFIFCRVFSCNLLISDSVNVVSFLSELMSCLERVKLSHPNYEYDVHSLVKAFYAEDQVTVITPETKPEKLAELDERFPDIIRTCGKESALTERRLWAEREASAEKHMREWGVEVTTLSAVEKARFRAAVEPMYAAFEEQSRLIQRIREA